MRRSRIVSWWRSASAAPLLSTEYSVLTAQRQVPQKIFDGAGKPVNAFGEIEEIRGRANRQTRAAQNGLRFARIEKIGVDINRSALDDQAGGRVVRIVFDDREYAARPEHPPDFARECGAFLNGDVVVDTDS